MIYDKKNEIVMYIADSGVRSCESEISYVRFIHSLRTEPYSWQLDRTKHDNTTLNRRD